MADSPIQRIKQLSQERDGLISTARKEALGRVHTAIAELRELGFTYELTEGGKVGRSKRGRRSGARQKKAGPCPVCGFQTDPLHDARKHRGQGKRKKAFTAKELADFGLKRL